MKKALTIKFDPSFWDNPELEQMAADNNKTKEQLIDCFQIAAAVANGHEIADHEKLMTLYGRLLTKLLGKEDVEPEIAKITAEEWPDVEAKIRLQREIYEARRGKGNAEES